MKNSLLRVLVKFRCILSIHVALSMTSVFLRLHSSLKVCSVPASMEILFTRTVGLGHLFRSQMTVSSVTLKSRNVLKFVMKFLFLKSIEQL